MRNVLVTICPVLLSSRCAWLRPLVREDAIGCFRRLREGGITPPVARRLRKRRHVQANRSGSRYGRLDDSALRPDRVHAPPTANALLIAALTSQHITSLRLSRRSRCAPL